MKTRSKLLFILSAGAIANVIWASIPPLFEKNADDSAEFAVTAQPIANAAKYARVVTGEGWPHSPKDEESVLVKLDDGTQLAYLPNRMQKRIDEHQKAVQEQREEREQERFNKMQEEKAREEKEKLDADAATTAMLGAGAFDSSVQLASLDTNTQTDVPMAQPGAERLANANDNFMQVTTDPVDVPVETIAAPVDTATHFSVTPGVSYYRLQLPDFMLPISLGVASFPNPYPTTDSTEYNLNEYGVMPTLSFDYNFENTHILKGLFGDRLHVLTDISYMHGSRQTTKDLGGTEGFVWNLNGGSAQPVNDEDNVTLNNQRTKLTYDLVDLTVAMAGEKSINSFLQFNPRMGVAFTYFKQQYNYDVDGTQPIGSVPFDVTGYSKVKSTYFGPMLGAQLLAKAGQHFGSFVDVELQALHAHTSFNANQDALSVTNKNSNAQNTDNVFTYRAKLGLGVDYYWQGINAPKSVKIGLKGGVDFWGYMPEVVNPNEPGSKDAHTERTTALNNYINMNISIPLM